MGNKYASTIRRSWAKKANVTSLTLPTPPADFSIVNGTDVGFEQLITLEAGVNEIDKDKNLLVHAGGIYCNYADGLVPADQDAQLALRITAKSHFDDGALTGVLTTVAGSRNVTGIGTAFTTELSPGDVIADLAVNGEALIVQSITDNFNLVLRTVPTYSNAGGTFNLLGLVSQDIEGLFLIQNLNEMVDIDQFFTPLIFGTSASEYTLLYATIIAMGSTLNTFTWKTISINADYAGEQVFFDVGLDIEY